MVVLKRTVMKKERESNLKSSEEQTESISFDDEFEFESDEPVAFEENEEDTDFEDYDYE